MGRRLYWLALAVLVSVPAYVQDSSGTPAGISLTFVDAPDPFRVAGKPALLSLTVVDKIGRPCPVQGFTVVLKTSDPKNRLNDLSVPLSNGRATVRVQWLSASDHHEIRAAGPGGIQGKISAIKVEPLPADIQFELGAPQTAPKFGWSGGSFKLQARSKSKGDGIGGVQIKIKTSKGTTLYPQTLVTDDSGSFNCHLFLPELCHDGSIPGDTPVVVHTFIDLDGDSVIDPGEPSQELPPFPLVHPCPQELIPCALQLLQILEQGGSIEPPVDPGPIVTSTTPILTPIQLEKIREARTYLQKNVIDFVQSGKWKGKFSEVKKRVEHAAKYLTGIAPAAGVATRLECAAELLKGNPDVRSFTIGLPVLKKDFQVPNGFEGTVPLIVFGDRGTELTSASMTTCFKLQATGVHVEGPGEVPSLKATLPGFDYRCLGIGPVQLTPTLSFRPDSTIIIGDGGVVAANQVVPGEGTLEFRLTALFVVKQDPPDLLVDTDRNGKVDPNDNLRDKKGDEFEHQDIEYKGTFGALVFANVDDDQDREPLDTAARDCDDDEIKTKNDFPDFAELVARQYVLPPGWGASLVMVGTDHQFIRMFRRLEEKEKAIIYPARGKVKGKDAYVFTENDIKDWAKGDLRFYIEGVVPGRQARIILTLTGGKGQAPADKVHILVTPILLMSNISPARRAFVTEWTKQGNQKFATAFKSEAEFLGEGNTTIVGGDIGNFFQDPIEIGIQKLILSDPTKVRSMPVAIDLPWTRKDSGVGGHPLVDYGKKNLLGKDFGSETIKAKEKKDKEDGGDYGGNLEAIPSVATNDAAKKTYPFGRVVTGTNASKDLKEYFDGQQAQIKQPDKKGLIELTVDPATDAGAVFFHVDEVMAVVPVKPAENGGKTFKILVGDFAEGLNLVQAAQGPKFAEVKKQYADMPVGAKNAVNTNLGNIRAKLTEANTGLGLTNADLIAVPVLYPPVFKTNQPSEYGTSNSVNLQVLIKDGTVKILVPTPMIKGEEWAAFKQKVSDQLTQNGVPAEWIRFIDTSEITPFGGEAHCVTNVQRSLD